MIKLFILIIFFLAIILFPFITYANHEGGCLTAAFWVEDSFYIFAATQLNDPKGFDNWSNRQMEAWNKILHDSGAVDCFKIKKIVKVRDGQLPLKGGGATNSPDLSDKTSDVQWGFPASGLTSDYWKNTISRGIDWGLLHELSHARYLIDEYLVSVGLNVSNIEVRDPHGDLVVGKYFNPIEWDVIYFNKSKDLMGGGGHFYAPHSVGALNLLSGQHTAERYGNTNPPDNYGAYLDDLPGANFLRILDTESKPIPGARIRIFQSVPNKHLIGGKTIDNIADIEGSSNIFGEVSVGGNPFGNMKIRPFLWGNNSRIYTNGSNSVFLLEVTYKDSIFYKFIEVSDFNLAYWSGAKTRAVFDIKTTIIPPATSSSTPQPTSTPIINEPSINPSAIPSPTILLSPSPSTTSVPTPSPILLTPAPSIQPIYSPQSGQAKDIMSLNLEISGSQLALPGSLPTTYVLDKKDHLSLKIDLAEFKWISTFPTLFFKAFYTYSDGTVSDQFTFAIKYNEPKNISKTPSPQNTVCQYTCANSAGITPNKGECNKYTGDEEADKYCKEVYSPSHQADAWYCWDQCSGSITPTSTPLPIQPPAVTSTINNCNGTIFSCADITCPNGTKASGRGCYEAGGDLNNRYRTECLRNCPVTTTTTPASSVAPNSSVTDSCNGNIYSCSDIKCPDGNSAPGKGCYEFGGDTNNHYRTECLSHCL